MRMTDSVQNLLLALRLKSDNTEDAPEPPILRARVPGVDSAASGDGACCDKSARGRENQTPSGTRGMIRSSQRIGVSAEIRGYLREEQQQEREREQVGRPPAGGHLAGRGAAAPRQQHGDLGSWELKSGDLRAGGRTPAAPGRFWGGLCSGLRRSRSDTTHKRPD